MAQSQSLVGGETLKLNDRALNVQFGYPELRVAYHVTVLDRVEIAPRFTFFYAGGGNRIAGTLTPPQVGIALSADVRWNFFSGQRFHAAAVWRLGFNMEFLNGVDAAIQLGLPGGIAMNYEVTERVDLLFGFEMKSSILVTSDPAVYNIPFVFNIGASIEMSRQIAFTVMFECVRTVLAARKRGQSGTLVDGWVAGLLGLEFYL